MTILLQATAVAKSFAGVRALQGVSFDLRAGEVHALVGENGAGKSTLIKFITGAIAADDGTLELGGRVVDVYDPITARRLGVAAIYQQPALFPDLSVAENIAIGLERGGTWRRVAWRERRQRARQFLQRIGASIDPDTEVRALSMPEQQLVEIARALGADARILIMDEPTASLSEREVANLFRVIRELRSQGVGIIYVSHRLNELFEIADRVTILRDGAKVASQSMTAIDRAEIIRLMVGREITAVFPKRSVSLGKTVLELRNIGCEAAGVQGVSFAVRQGEILGLAGLVGAGRTELARVLFGLTPANTGEIRLHGRSIAIDCPASAIKAGIAYVPEDRRRHGVVLEMPIAANASLAVLRKLCTAGWIRCGRERALAQSFVDRLGVKMDSLDSLVGALSGGNQQKVALARWLASEPSVLILDEPTQGIDVGAKAEIHRLMGELASQGLAMVMISSDLPEILGMSDRIAVMHGGSVVAILDQAEVTQERVLSLALGHGAR